jgi:hypothetical protein
MEDFRDDRGKPDPTKKFPISKEIPIVRKTKSVEKSKTTTAGEIKTEKVRTY